MTYNVSSETLNPTLTHATASILVYLCVFITLFVNLLVSGLHLTQAVRSLASMVDGHSCTPALMSGTHCRNICDKLLQSTFPSAV